MAMRDSSKDTDTLEVEGRLQVIEARVHEERRDLATGSVDQNIYVSEVYVDLRHRLKFRKVFSVEQAVPATRRSAASRLDVRLSLQVAQADREHVSYSKTGPETACACIGFFD